jgi:hypothetical protein
VKLELPEEISVEFATRLAPIGTLPERSEIQLTQIPAPKGIAEEAVAVSAEVIHAEHSEADRGVGRLVICRDSSYPAGWNSDYRIILYAKSPVDLDMGKDDVVDELPWNWLMDSLEVKSANFHSEAGTTTRILSTGHGSLSAQSQHAEIEIRASWAPEDEDFSKHLDSFQRLMALISGLDPGDGTVVAL